MRNSDGDGEDGFISSILGGIFGPGDDTALPEPTPEQTRSTFQVPSTATSTPAPSSDNDIPVPPSSSPRLGPSSPFLASPVPTGTPISVSTVTRTASILLESVTRSVSIVSAVDTSMSMATVTIASPSLSISITATTQPAAKAPLHKINGGAIAGGIVGAVLLIGAAIALFLRRRFRRRSVPEEMLPTSAGPDSPLQTQVLPFNVTAGEQTVVATDNPFAHSVVEPQEAIPPAILGWHRRYQRVNWSDRDESRSQNIAGPAAGGAALEMQMREMAERMALMETRLQMRWLAEEQPPGYTAARTPVNNYDLPASPDTSSTQKLSYFQEDL